MKLLILAVGNKMPSWITEGFNEYAKRMPREATIALIEIKPEARNSGKTAAQIMEAEAQRIRAALPAYCTVHRTRRTRRDPHHQTTHAADAGLDAAGTRCRVHHRRRGRLARIGQTAAHNN